MARLRWFIAGAAAATGALVAAPSAYDRLRGIVDRGALPAAPAMAELTETAAEVVESGNGAATTPTTPTTPPPAAAFATYDRDAEELREKIESTRGRIRDKAAPPADEDEEPTQ